MMALYYKHYDPKTYMPKSLPYQLVIDDPEDKERIVALLDGNGFRCVSGLNVISHSLYVNFTLRRYGGAAKPVSSSSINGGMMKYGDFMENIWKPYQINPAFREMLENNWVQSASIELKKTYVHFLDCIANYPLDYASKEYDRQRIADAVRQIGEFAK